MFKNSLRKHFCIFFLLSFSWTHIQCQNTIVVSKQHMNLIVINQNSDTVFLCKVALGRGIGQKEKVGDMRTPEGLFHIVEICDSKSWKHDFHDGKGLVAGSYGPFFIRLSVPGFIGIGIHGTCFPESIGKRATEGCIRLKNEDLIKLVKIISVNDSVFILPEKNN